MSSITTKAHHEPKVLIIDEWRLLNVVPVCGLLIYDSDLGAGQGGLTAAARLKQLQVHTLIIDKNSCIGDNWRNTYHQLVLHDSVW